MASIFSFKFMKKSKSVLECTHEDAAAFTHRPKHALRRRASSADSASLEAYVQLQEFRLQQRAEAEQKKHSKASGHRTRRKSTGRKNNPETDDEILYNAVIAENLTLVRHLLSFETININSYQSGWTILHHACRIGNTDIINLLLEAGANSSLLNREGMSPLRLAVTCGNFEAASYLINEKGVSCHEIRDGFQEKNTHPTPTVIKKNIKHGKS